MSAPEQRSESGSSHAPGAATPSPLDPSPGRANRATTDEADTPVTQPPLKQHGDALLDGSGSRQGLDPDPDEDAAPHE